MNHTAFFDLVKKGPIGDAYLMEGPEEYIKQQALERLKEKLLPAGLEEMNLTELNDPDADALIAAAETLPFMGEKRLVVVRECSLLTAGKKAEDEKKVAAISDYVGHISPSTCLIFYVKGKADGRKKLYTLLKKKNAIVDFCVDRQEVKESFIMTCPVSAEKRDVTKDVLVAALIGAVLGLGSALVACMVSFLTDDSVYLPVSFEKRYGIPMLGTTKSAELSANAEKLCAGTKKLAVTGVCETVSVEEVVKLLQEKVPGIVSGGTVSLTKEWLSNLDGADRIILAVEAGRRDGKQIERIIGFLKKQEITVAAAVLCNADESLLARYYRPGIFSKYKKVPQKKQAGDKA